MLLGWVDDDSATMSMSVQRHLAHWTMRDGTYARGGETGDHHRQRCRQRETDYGSGGG